MGPSAQRGEEADRARARRSRVGVSGSPPRGPRPGLRERLGNPIDWTLPARTAFLAAVTIPFAIYYFGRVVYVLGHPEIEPYLSRPVLRAMLWGLGSLVVLMSLVVAWGWRHRRVRTESPGIRRIAWLSVVVWFIYLGGLAYAVGALTSPIWAACIAGLVCTLLLVGTRPAIDGIIAAALITLGTTLAERLGWIDYAPMYRGLPVPVVEGRLVDAHSYAVLVMLLATTAAVAVPMSLILARWRRREQLFREASKTDALTGLANRRCFFEVLEREFDRAVHQDRPLSILIVDVDHFKAINDTHGHLVGDAALRAIGGALEALVRDQDLVARIGGDEFAVVLPDTPAADAEVVAGRLRRAVGDTLLVAEPEIRAAISVGVGELGGAMTAADELLHLADDLMMRTKQAGRVGLAARSEVSPNGVSEAPRAASPSRP